MRKYDSYKDSGVEWIGDIPSHWDVTRIKYQYQIGRGRVISNEDLVDNGVYPVYSSQTLNNGCLGFIDTYDFDDKLITWTTDGANAGTVFLREGKFNCTNVCGTLKAKSDEIIPEFYYYFLQYATQFYKRPDTNGAKIMNNEMAVILSLKLSSDEQTAIANYLDQKTREIDNLITKKERLIQLLEEERTAIINQAVTKGLDPNVPVKDSGIEWLGEIPAHWEVKRIKHTTYVKGRIGWKGLRSDEFLENSDSYVVTGTDFKDGIIKWETCYQVPIDRYEDDPFIKLKENDLLITKDGTIGKIAIVENMPKIATLNSGVFLTRPLHNEYVQEFMYWILFSDVFKSFYDYNKSGSTIQHLYQNIFYEFKYPLPLINEQLEIVSYIKTKTLEMDSIITKTLLEIELLKEYKTALISEVVTGKVDVRNEKLN